MSKSDEVKKKIIAKFIEGLEQHLMSEKIYPNEVTIQTLYNGCMQTLTIKFDLKTED